MTAPQQPKRDVVHIDEFERFEKRTESSFRSLEMKIQAVAQSLSDFVASRTGINWTAASVLLGMLSIAGALVWTMQSNETSGRRENDEHLAALFGQASSYERDARLLQGETILRRLDALAREFENHRDRPGHPQIVERVEHAFQQIRDNESGIQDMDNVLQREMRLLDEVLQREVGLHVDRLGDLIDALDERVGRIELGRFTAKDGMRLERAVESIGEEQRRRSSSVYSNEGSAP